MTPNSGIPDQRVPGYLGRILADEGTPVGTCFQVAPGILVTSGHVLESIGAVEEGVLVQVDPLAGGVPVGAIVRGTDLDHDLAVLACDHGLLATAGPLTSADRLGLRTPVSVTGHAVLDDAGIAYRFLTAVGYWAGGITRDDIKMSRLIADRVVPGMSGAPVIRDSDGTVAGVVCGRFNSVDGWPPSTAWAARTEDLAVLLQGVAGLTSAGISSSEPPRGYLSAGSVRRFVDSALSDSEVEDLALDHFPDVFREFSTGMGRRAKIRLLVEYADRRERLDTLISLVRESNPVAYERHLSELLG